jgi:hypothetical protein
LPLGTHFEFALPQRGHLAYAPRLTLGGAVAVESAGDKEFVVVDEAEEIVDKRLVDETVGWIREKIEATVHKGALERGEYVFDKFFDREPARVASKDARKKASFRALVERCDSVDLPISKSTLNNAVGVAVVRELVPSGSPFLQLPASHQFGRQFLKALVRGLSEDQKKQALKDAQDLSSSLNDLVEKLQAPP